MVRKYIAKVTDNLHYFSFLPSTMSVQTESQSFEPKQTNVQLPEHHLVELKSSAKTMNEELNELRDEMVHNKRILYTGHKSWLREEINRFENNKIVEIAVIIMKQQDPTDVWILLVRKKYETHYGALGDFPNFDRLDDDEICDIITLIVFYEKMNKKSTCTMLLASVFNDFGCHKRRHILRKLVRDDANYDFVELLLINGAVKRNYCGLATIAFEQNNERMARLLLQHGIVPNCDSCDANKHSTWFDSFRLPNGVKSLLEYKKLAKIDDKRNRCGDRHYSRLMWLLTANYKNP